MSFALGSLGVLAFTLPLLLLALIALPLIWFLLRATPPTPREEDFPALTFLMGLDPKENEPAKTPWWLLLLRLTAIAAIIVALAGPVLNPEQGGDGSDSPVLLVIGNDWSVATDWPDRIAAADRVLALAARDNRAVRVISTASPEDATGLLPAGNARRLLPGLEPRPWPVDATTLKAALEDIPPQHAVHLISTGLKDIAQPRDADLYSRFESLTIYRQPLTHFTRLLPPERDGLKIRFAVEDAGPVHLDSPTLSVVLKDRDGLVLAQTNALIMPGDDGLNTGIASFNLPRNLRNRVFRAEIAGVRHAGAVQLLDDQWRRRSIGLIGNADLASTEGLLSATYYLRTALDAFADVSIAAPETLLTDDQNIIFHSDDQVLNDQELRQIARWVQGGGSYIRFAGPELAQDLNDNRLSRTAQDLLPVALRPGERNLGGAMDWREPAEVVRPSAGPFAATDFSAGKAGVRRQVLAQPGPDLDGAVWLRLEDGTPIITWRDVGDGRVVLVHTTADSRWSDLVFSGLFVELLRGLVQSASADDGASSADRPLPALRHLDASGRLLPSPASAKALSADSSARLASAATPPGLYGNDSELSALNLSRQPGRYRPATADDWPEGTEFRPFDRQQETDLLPWLLLFAAALLLLDLIHRIATVQSRNGISGIVAAAGILAGALLFSGPPPASAQTESDSALLPEKTLNAVLTPRLAYIRTSDRRTDATVNAGLFGLSRFIVQRSTVQLGPPVGLNLARDDIAFYPMIYWAVTEDQEALNPSEVAKLNRYMAGGGLLLIDTRDGGLGQTLSGGRDRRLIRALRGIKLPRLVPVPGDHVLRKTFFLLNRYGAAPQDPANENAHFPGRWLGGQTWIAADTASGRNGGRVNDAVSPVILGNADWAGAWATDSDGAALFAVVPGLNRQREFAFRFGMNAVMYALAGNYKSDQVHVPFLLERLGDGTVQNGVPVPVAPLTPTPLAPALPRAPQTPAVPAAPQ